MGNPDSRLTYLAQKLTAVTSQIFRCHGLQQIPQNADRLGIHDLAYWLIFVAVMCAWFLFLFAPQHERLEMLSGRRHVLASHLAAEKCELQRLQSGIEELQNGNSHAWERAARNRLGWLEPGEITDAMIWRRYKDTAPAKIINRSPEMPSLEKEKPGESFKSQAKIPPPPSFQGGENNGMAARTRLQGGNRSGSPIVNKNDGCGSAVSSPPIHPSIGSSPAKSETIKSTPVPASSSQLNNWL